MLKQKNELYTFNRNLEKKLSSQIKINQGHQYPAMDLNAMQWKKVKKHNFRPRLQYITFRAIN